MRRKKKGDLRGRILLLIILIWVVASIGIVFLHFTQQTVFSESEIVSPVSSMVYNMIPQHFIPVFVKIQNTPSDTYTDMVFYDGNGYFLHEGSSQSSPLYKYDSETQWYKVTSQGVFPKYNFDVEINFLGYYIEKEDNFVNVKVKNNWKEDLSGRLVVYLITKEPFSGKEIFYKVESRSMLFTKNEWLTETFRLPEGLVTAQYDIKAVAIVDTYSVSGVDQCLWGNPYPCKVCGCMISTCYSDFSFPWSWSCSGSGQDLGVRINTGNILAGSDVRTFSVTEQPIYGGVCGQSSDCKSGYVCTVGKYCVREDVVNAKLGCQIMGCPPPTGNTEYICTSSGICTELVYQVKDCKADSDCPSEAKCDVGSGICINTLIYNEIIQCEVPEECQVPCQGVVVGCVNKKCVYSSKCDVNTEFKDCVTEGCPEKSYCKRETGVCYTTETIEKIIVKTCEEKGCPEGFKCVDKVCVEEFKIKWYYIVGVASLLSLILLLIGFLFKKKRR